MSIETHRHCIVLQAIFLRVKTSPCFLPCQRFWLQVYPGKQPSSTEWQTLNCGDVKKITFWIFRFLRAGMKLISVKTHLYWPKVEWGTWEMDRRQFS